MEHELFWSNLAFFLVGALLICVGFARRDHGSGIVLLWLGAICMLGLVFYHLPQLLHLV